MKFIHVYRYISVSMDDGRKSIGLELCDTIYNISMVSTTHNKTVKLGITLPRSLIKQTDKTRGDVKRSRYICRAIEYYVNVKQGNVRTPQNLEE